MAKTQGKCCAGDGDIVEGATSVASVDASSVAEMSMLFKALGDERRLCIVEMIASEPGICACKLLDAFDITQPTLSHHTRILTQAGLLICYRQGKWAHYSINRPALDAVRTLIDNLDR